MIYLSSRKRKQSSPKRTPFFNISNKTQNIPSKFGKSSKEASAWIKQESEFHTPSDSHMGLSATLKCDVIKREHAENNDEANENLIIESILEEECSKVLREARVAVQSKLDLRKSSWMNGFMMYSRIHRKKFIKRNPGFHTALISKLMGHTWRSMTVEEQHPYTYVS
ncbi:transcription factor Sox-14 [Elysia marginata]|uniref:Sex-determining region Y protein n=1 Tax=Elysia marginata TaxID=1093978 RepID=A0AAV4HJX7_9GAST|nr:transcription factor Sox-14 [Elysia marginata]